MAGLLARQGRIDELRAYAADEHHGSATQCLAEELEARGDVDGAAAPYRHPGNPEHRREDHAVLPARLLVRHGQGGAAVEGVRAYGEGWVVVDLLAASGRTAEALALLGPLSGRRQARAEYLVELDRTGEAVAVLRSGRPQQVWGDAGAGRSRGVLSAPGGPYTHALVDSVPPLRSEARPAVRPAVRPAARTKGRDPVTPALDLAFEIRAHLAPARHVGHGDGESLAFTPITGGTVTGPRLTGTVLPGGGDWGSTRGAVCQLDARYLLQAEDGAVIDVVNRGYYRLGADCPAQYEEDGLQVSEAGVYFRTAPVFRTDAPAHRWLAETVFVGLARPEDEGRTVVIRMYALR